MTTNDDAEHLRLLTTFHFVVAGIVGLISLFPLIHLFVGTMLVADSLSNRGPSAPPIFVGAMFIVIALIFIVGGGSLALCLAAAGQFLRERRRYMFCFITAAVSCAFMPFGTVLGVFTLLVLSRQSVKVLFGVDKSVPPQPEGA